MAETGPLTGLLAARGNIYKLFSDLYYGMPDDGLYERLRTMTPLLAEMGEALDDKELSDAAERVSAALKGTEAGKELYSRMSQAFTRLYLLGSRSLSLQESVWLSQEQQARKEPYFRIRAYYKAFQFKRETYPGESDESLTIMLLFMSVMSKAAAEKVEQGDNESAVKLLQAQETFLSDHLLKWVPSLCESSIEFARKEGVFLYGEFAGLLRSYIVSDRGAVEEMLSMLTEI